MYLQLENIIRQWRGKRVLVIGDAMLDVDLPVTGEAPSPEHQGGRVLRVDTGVPTAGGAANVAVNLKAMGAEPFLLAVVGADANAHQLGACIHGVDSYLVDDMTRPTTTKMRIGNSVRLDCESTKPLNRQAARELRDEMMEQLPHTDAVILSDYGKGVLCQEVLAELARQFPHCPVIWDPKHILHPELLHGTVTHTTPNLAELRALTGVWHRTAARKKLAKKLGTLGTLVVTEGERGAVVRRKGKECRVRTKRVRNPDVRGAGDSFVAAFALALAAGTDVIRSAAIGNAAARVAVSVPGTVDVAAHDLMLELGTVAAQNHGVLMEQFRAGML